MKLVHITWLDSCHTSGWTNIKDYKPATKDEMTYDTIGYLLHEDDLSVGVCQSKGTDCIDAIMEIPKCAILEMKDL